ncbi:sulfite exporter TauE/SafE family protein [Arsenicitalea aurantiaca]|uniref:Probable membrane transporter protein n=1 Tax=Arsenicitalea aurantiaca TaxID=1783274 RepID=A0A433X7K8_9HYPH|nr:sulfite exporter TauE/SafE family protein [Arsenicitalea aurantiaca]RUT30054.1 sulfite exporter TauE/SafE family protein [Arsenicitalea aurantiaca]
MDFADYAVLTAALAAGAFVKGATGMGLPMIALPALAAVFGLQHAVVLMIIPIIVTNAWQTWSFRHMRHDESLRFLPRFLVGSGLGVVAGSIILTTAPERALLLGLGLILLFYVAFRLMNPHLVVQRARSLLLGLPMGLGAGVLHGATGISAPIGVTFIHAMGFERPTYVFAVSSMFLVLAVVQLPSLFLLGAIRAEWLLQGLFALVPILLVMPIGQTFAGRLSRKAFDRMILVFLGLIGLKLVAGI